MTAMTTKKPAAAKRGDAAKPVPTAEEIAAAQQVLADAHASLEAAQDRLRIAKETQAEVEGRQRRIELGAVKDAILAACGDTEPVNAAADRLIGAVTDILTLLSARNRRLTGHIGELRRHGVIASPANQLAPQPDLVANLGIAWRETGDGPVLNVDGRSLRPITPRQLVYGAVGAALQRAGLTFGGAGMPEVSGTKDFAADPEQWIADRW